MGSFLRFVTLFVLLVAGFVLLVLPFLLSPLLTQMVRDSGLRAATLDVTVAALDPTLLLGRSRLVRLVATDVDASPARIGRMDIAVGDASYFDRPAEAASAVATLTPDQTESLVRMAARRAGVKVDSVTVGDTGVVVNVDGVEEQARLAVQGGALLLDPGVGGAIVLLQPAPSDPWALQEAWISPDGLNVRGTVDMERLAAGVIGG